MDTCVLSLRAKRLECGFSSSSHLLSIIRMPESISQPSRKSYKHGYDSWSLKSWPPEYSARIFDELCPSQSFHLSPCYLTYCNRLPSFLPSFYVYIPASVDHFTQVRVTAINKAKGNRTREARPLHQLTTQLPLSANCLFIQNQNITTSFASKE
jgi:hypothetical protein